MYRIAMTLTLGLLCAPALQAQDDPAAIVAASIEAHGGAAALARWNNLTYEGSLTLFFGASQLTGEATIAIRDGSWMRREAKLEFRGSPFVFEEASTGTTAWQRRESRIYDYPPDDFNAWLAQRPGILLRAAAAGSSALRNGGTMDLEGHATLAIDFEERDGTTRILIDPETKLVRGLEYKILRNEGMGKKEEAFIKKIFSDYRSVDGLLFPHTNHEFADGTTESTLEVEQIKLTPPDIAVFARPESDDEAQEWGDQTAN
jgi:hypothetical protein